MPYVKMQVERREAQEMLRAKLETISRMRGDAQSARAETRQRKIAEDAARAIAEREVGCAYYC